jgi:hypothetical protein
MFCDDADVDQFAVFYGSSSSCPDGNTTTTNSTLDLNITSQVLPFGVCALSNGRYMKIVEVINGTALMSLGSNMDTVVFPLALTLEDVVGEFRWMSLESGCSMSSDGQWTIDLCIAGKRPHSLNDSLFFDISLVFHH